MVNTIAVGIVLGCILLGVLGMIGFGFRNIAIGKSNLKRVSVMAVPLALFGVFYATSGTLNQAGVYTLLVMLGIMALSIVISSMRRTFNL
ncbi:MAG: hypothetical protein ACNA78_02320 [Balneolaceae bacterium]